MLAVDIGNTNLVVGLRRAGHAGDWDAVWRLATPATRTADDWAAALLPLLERGGPASVSVSHAIISSVVPRLTGSLAEFCERYLGVAPLIVSQRLNLGIALDVDEPHELGADRIANAVAAWDRHRAACIVVDLGTATKLEAISADGRYVGGAIAIGLGLSIETLAARAARLYAVELAVPPSAIGRDTVTHVQAGVVLGHAHLVEGLVADVRRELGEVQHVILTGGYAGVLAGHLPSVTEIDPLLTLAGLRVLLERNPRAGTAPRQRPDS